MSRDFHFKRFSVTQQNSAMKVGTDGVLLGAWCSVPDEGGAVLDVGTGTGLLALMVAQRSERRPCPIMAIEPHPGSLADARNNIRSSPWADRIEVSGDDLESFAQRQSPPRRQPQAQCHCMPQCHRLTENTINTASLPQIQSGSRFRNPMIFSNIVCNPPFFDNSLLPPQAGRTAARHTVSLSHEVLVRVSAGLLCDNGILSVILPSATAGKFTEICANHGLSLYRRTSVMSVREGPPVRELLEFSPNGSPVQADTLTIEDGGRHRFSEQYVALTRDFYLKF